MDTGGEKARFYRCALRLAACAGALAFSLIAAAQAPAPPPAPAAAAKPARLALVIGNAAYRDAPLANPVNDAADMARVLEASGFTVMKRENATLREMHLALREFGDRLGRQTAGLFYFAGHGLQVRGRNYLLPVDADIAREDEVAFGAMDLAAVMEKLDSAKNPVNLVILDACRDNPFGTRFAASSKGLAPIDAPPGTLIAFATAPGTVAADGKGRNGLYTHHLVRQIEAGAAPVEEVFKAVRTRVRAESKSLQVPWENTSLESPFHFREPKAAPGPAPASSTRRAKTAPASVRAPPTFATGDSWTYRIVSELGEPERRSTVKIAEARGDEIRFTSGSVADAAGNALRTVRGPERVDVFSPSAHQYVFPLREGATWTLKSVQTSGARKYDLQVRLKVGPEETVEVPAGRLPAVRIEREVRWKQRDSGNAGTRTQTYWYNSAVKRYVRLEETNVTAEGKVLQRERMELVSWQVR